MKQIDYTDRSKTIFCNLHGQLMQVLKRTNELLVGRKHRHVPSCQSEGQISQG